MAEMLPRGPEMPVDAVLPALLDALGTHSSAVLAAEPGAGKTTRVPFALLGAEWCTGRVLVLEPRRLAARSAAAFMARQIGEEPGRTVGYRVRLESRVSADTRIEFLTEGVFARRIMDDPELAGVSAVVFDEFHERSLDADFGLALALDIQRALRSDLRLLVMSATLETQAVARLLGGAPLIESPGRTFDVEIRHEDRSGTESVEDAMARIVRRTLAQEEGSILAFLPGQKEIRRTAERLTGLLPADASLHQLYGALDAREQDAAIRPPPSGARKVVLATAIAETSLTIDGVRIVIDSGLKRVPRYEARTGLTRLETVRASRSAITQRAGRAGRTAPGVAIRLWREQQTAALPARDTPEILEADLSGLALDLAAWGVHDPAQLDFLDLPPTAAWNEARELLQSLEALDASGAITAQGRAMRELPLPPRFAHMVVRAAGHGQGLDAAMLAVLASERGLGGNSPDLAARLERFRNESGERASAARGLARSIARGVAAGSQSAPQDLSPGALLSLAWPDRIARSRGPGGGFRLANGRGANIDPGEGLARAPFLVVADLQGTAAAARILSAAPIEEAEIVALHGGRIASTRELRLDPASGQVRARQVRKLGSLVLSETTAELTPEDTPQAILLAHLRATGLDGLDWGKGAARLRERVAFLHAQDPAWPDMGEAALVEELEDWLAPFLVRARGLRDVTPALLHDGLAHRLALAGRSAGEVERHAPELFTTPTGSRLPIRYGDGKAVLAVRVQELYGMTQHPAIMDGALPLTLELLSPAHRPIQVTEDLPGFWRGSWAAVRSEMRGRYPRHLWPEDPAAAQPTSRAKPRGT